MDHGNSAGDDWTVFSPEAFIDFAPSVASAAAAAGNKKKKSAKKAARKKAEDLAGKVGDHLQTYGWAVCDGFLPLELVRRVRVEAGLFTDHYEQSEIWVGKQADVGAHLSVPSVRGDKVLWMCGGACVRACCGRVEEGGLFVCKIRVGIYPRSFLPGYRLSVH